MKDENPLHPMMMGNMPGLPEIIQSAMPVFIPQMTYDQNPVGMIFGNFKRKRIEKSTETEAKIAENTYRTLVAKLSSVKEIVTYTARIELQFAEYKHAKTMFELEEEEKKMDIYMKQSQATQAGFEAKLSELDFKTREKQFNKMMEEE